MSDGINIRAVALHSPGQPPNAIRVEVWPLPESEMAPLFEAMRLAAIAHLRERGLTSGASVNLSDTSGRVQ